MDKRITEEELQNYDGQHGRPAYVAHKGKVYDVSASRLWSGGAHQHRHQAGKELTADFAAAPHDEIVLQRVPVVGTLIGPERKELPTLLRSYLDLHPHPIAVHFPIALTLAAAGFLILYLLTKIAGLVDSAYYTLLTGVIVSPMAIIAGAISWWYNYRRKLTMIFKGKASLAIVLFVVEVVVVILWSMNRDALLDHKAIGWVYFALVIVMSGLVISLGKLGGDLVFPSKKRP